MGNITGNMGIVTSMSIAIINRIKVEHINLSKGTQRQSWIGKPLGFRVFTIEQEGVKRVLY